MRRTSPTPNPAQTSFVFEDLSFPARETSTAQEATHLPPITLPPEHVPVYTVFLRRSDALAVRERPAMRAARDVLTLLSDYLKETDREHLVVLLLNAKNGVIGINTVSVGILDSALVHPREVFKPAILANAASILLAHNHPSGDPTPSPEDRRVTRRLYEAGQLLGIDVLDHIVLGDEGRFYSFKEQGKL